MATCVAPSATGRRPTGPGRSRCAGWRVPSPRSRRASPAVARRCSMVPPVLGANDFGQLGNGTTTDSLTPATVTGLETSATEVIAGSGYACSPTTFATVKCWGGTTRVNSATERQPSATPVDVIGLSGIYWISRFDTHTCARTSVSGMMCWGPTGMASWGRHEDQPDRSRPGGRLEKRCHLGVGRRLAQLRPAERGRQMLGVWRARRVGNRGAASSTVR